MFRKSHCQGSYFVLSSICIDHNGVFAVCSIAYPEESREKYLTDGRRFDLTVPSIVVEVLPEGGEEGPVIVGEEEDEEPAVLQRSQRLRKQRRILMQSWRVTTQKQCRPLKRVVQALT